MTTSVQTDCICGDDHDCRSTGCDDECPACTEPAPHTCERCERRNIDCACPPDDADCNG